MAALSELDRRILAFEQGWWRLPGAKEREILERFGMPVTFMLSMTYLLLAKRGSSRASAISRISEFSSAYDVNDPSTGVSSTSVTP